MKANEKKKAVKTNEYEKLREENKRLFDLLEKHEIDLNVRKEIDKALVESEERYRTIVDFSTNAIILHDRGEIVFINKAAAKMFGLSDVSESLGRSIFDYVHSDEHRGMLDRIAKVVEPGEFITKQETRLLKKDGREFYGDVSSTQINVNGKKLNYVQITDITEWKNDKYKLLQSEEKYRALSEIIIDAASALKIGEDGAFHREWSLNKLFDAYGYSADEIDTFEKWGKIVHPDDLDFFKSKIKEILKGNIVSADLRIITKDGKIRWINNSVRPEFDADNKRVIRLISGVKDITEKKEIEEKLKETIDIKDKFFSIVAHDLKSPFQGLLGFSQVILDDYEKLSKEEIKNWILEINGLLKQMYSLVINLLEWSRIQSGRVSFNPMKLSIYKTFNDAINLLSPNALKKGVFIKNRVSSEYYLKADFQMLHSIFENLISNAIKFSREGDLIEINAEKDDDFYKIIVKDSGVGIKKEDLEKLFRLDVTLSTEGTADEKGSGLGLILCKELIELHGGKIMADSEYGKGAVFTIYMPAYLE